MHGCLDMRLSSVLCRPQASCGIAQVLCSSWELQSTMMQCWMASTVLSPQAALRLQSLALVGLSVHGLLALLPLSLWQSFARLNAYTGSGKLAFA